LDRAAILEIFADSNSMWTGSDPLSEAMHALLRDLGAWTGSATELLDQLRNIAPLAVLPSTPKGLSQALARVAGLRITRKRDSHGDRVLTIEATTDASAKTARH
jgi:hypothetical protein